MQPLKWTAACLSVNTRAGRRQREVRGPTGQRSDAFYYSRGRRHLDRITSEELASLTEEVKMSWTHHYTSWWHFLSTWIRWKRKHVNWCALIFDSVTNLENRSSSDNLLSLLHRSTHRNNGGITGFNVKSLVVCKPNLLWGFPFLLYVLQ